MITTIIYVIASIIGGILYRLGGAGNVGDKFDFLRTTKTRDYGVPLVLILLLYPSHWLGLFLTYGLQFGSLTLGYGGKGEPKNEQSFLYRMFGKYIW